MVEVHSPTVPGAIERLRRAVDSIEYLRKRFPLEYSVASRIRRAYDTICGSIGGVADFERLRHPASPGSPPSMGHFAAAKTLNSIKKTVDPTGQFLIQKVVCDGYILADIAKGRSEQERYGAHLRHCLKALAEAWGWSDNILKWRGDSWFRPSPGEYTTSNKLPITGGKVVHATRNKVFSS